MFKRLFRPFLALDGDETTGGAAPVEAPAVDQPDTSVSGPEAPAPATPDEEGTTPTEPEAPDTPDADTDADEFTDLSAVPPELQDRAKEMQADYTRKTQALAERNAELDNAVSFVTDLVADEPNETMEAVFKTLAEKLGYDLEGDDEHEPTADEPEPEEESQFRDPRLDPILAEREQKAQAEAEAEHEAYLDTVETEITDGITALAKADGIDLTSDELDVIFDGVLALPTGEDGGPAVKAAYDRFKAASKASFERWRDSKKSTKAPDGTTAEEPVDFNDEEARLAYTARAVEAAQRAQQGL